MNSDGLNANGVFNEEKAIVNGKGELEAMPPPYKETPNKNEKMENDAEKEAPAKRKRPVWKTVIFFVCGIDDMDETKSTQTVEPVSSLLELIRETPTQKLIGFTNLLVIASIAVGLYIFFFWSMLYNLYPSCNPSSQYSYIKVSKHIKAYTSMIHSYSSWIIHSNSMLAISVAIIPLLRL